MSGCAAGVELGVAVGVGVGSGGVAVGVGVGVAGVGVGEGGGVTMSEITKMVLLVPVMEALRVSVAVIVWLPSVLRVALKVPKPFVNVLLGGRVPWLVLVKWTVPV